MRKRTRVSISLGVAVLFIFFLVGGKRYIDAEILLPWALAAIVHELGHIAAAKAAGIRIEGMHLGLLGARLSLSDGVISYGKEAAVALAGPGINIFCAMLFRMSFPAFCEFSLLLGVLNLLPIVSFDGYRILYCIISKLSNSLAAERVLKVVSLGFIFMLWLISVYFLIRYKANVSLFVFACALFIKAAM